MPAHRPGNGPRGWGSAEPAPDPERVAPWRSLAVFFVLACGFSWACWVLGAVSTSDVAHVLDLVAPFGPALAAVLVAGRSTAHGRAPGVARAAGVVAVLALSLWVLWDSWVAAWPGSGWWTKAALLLVSGLPAAVTWLVWPVPRRGTPRGMSRLVWIATAALLFPALGVAGQSVGSRLSGSGLMLSAGGASSAGAATVALVFVSTALCGGPLGEEPGWRGFALPRLQSTLSPLLASVVVGLGWATWHLPLQLRGAYEQSMGGGVSGVLVRFGSQVAVAVVFTWLFNRSGGSVLVVVVLHASLNNTAGYWFSENVGFQIGVGLLAVVLVIADRMDQHGDDRLHASRGDTVR